MKKRRITLEESQRASLEILKAVIKLCDRLQLNYWITYGTLLGAIRHGGFIPWDDDLDIAMKREEYDILINYIITHKNECYPLVVHNKYTVKNCFYNISRICDTRYLLEFKDYDYVSGVFVDIYPYEALGDEKRYAEWMKWFRRNTKIKKFINMSCSKSFFYGKNWLNRVINLPFCIYSKLKGNMYFLAKLDMYKPEPWEGSTYIGVPCWGAAIYKNYYDSFMKIKFEDIYVNIPAKYDEILKEAYGNYMEYPPLEQRKPYHGYEAFIISE